MSVHQCEVFGHFFYSPELSYAELLEREAVLIESLDRTLQDLGGVHIEFTSEGDSLRVQCLFSAPEEGMFHAACDAVLPVLGHDMEGRFLFVDKDLKGLVLYCLAENQWKEAHMVLPSAAEGIRTAEKDPPVCVLPD